MIKSFSFLSLLVSLMLYSQSDNPENLLRIKDTIAVKSKEEAQVLKDIEKVNTPLEKPKYSPTRAGLYSAVLPGLGQYYNRKYWKIPLVWGAVGTGVGIAVWNQKQYTRYRNAFVSELNGQTHEFSDINGITKEVLGRAQDRAKRQRDYAIAIAGLIYVLGIVDAVVDAHLYDQRTDPDLAIKPIIIDNQWNVSPPKAGISISYNF